MRAQRWASFGLGRLVGAGSAAVMVVSLLVAAGGPASAIPVVMGTTFPDGTTLNTSQTWGPGGSPYVIVGKLTVASGVTLTVLPGTVVKFDPREADGGEDRFGTGLLVRGRMVADGSGSSPVIFTSVFDDSAGGDSDGGGRAAARGDWGEIRFDPSDTMSDAAVAAVPPSVLNNVSVRYGAMQNSGYCPTGAVTVDSRGRLQVSRSEFVENQFAGVRFETPRPGVGVATVVSSRFADGKCGADIAGGDVVGNVFEDSLTTFGLHALDPSAARVYGNVFDELVQAWAPSGGLTRADVDFRDNDFVRIADTGWQDLQDWRFNWWGRPLPKVPPPDCWHSDIDYQPPVTHEFLGEFCEPGSVERITGYVHEVYPAMRHAPPVPEAGIGANPNLPAGLAVPLGQTLGLGCDPCANNRTSWYGNPVNTATGNETKFSVDAQLGGAGQVFRFTRAYNSLSERVGVLGRGWQHGYEARLDVSEPDRAVYVGADGQQAGYNRDGSTFDPDPGVRAELATIAGGAYRLTQPDLTRLEFDADGRLSAVLDRSGVGVSLGYSGGQLATVTDAAGRQVTLGYVSGRLTRVELPDGRAIMFGYTNGLLTSATDLRGKTTTYGYNADELLTTVTDPAGGTVTNTYHPQTDRVTSQTDQRGKLTTFDWEPTADAGAPAGTGMSTVTAPDGGRWVERYVGRVLVEQTNPLGHSVELFYDADLNVVKEVDERGFATTMTYDGRGNMLSRTSPAPLSDVETWTYNSKDQPLTWKVAAGTSQEQTIQYGYGAADRLTSITQPSNRTTTFSYTTNGQLDVETSPEGVAVDHDYDADGNLEWVRTELGSDTRYGYDDTGRLTSVVDPRGNVTGATPADFTTTFAYNDADQLTAVTDPLQHATTTSYDDLGRVDTVTNPANELTGYDYDPASNLTVVTDPAGGTEFDYDDVGNLIEMVDPTGATTSYGYDRAGQRTSMVTARGNEAGADPGEFTWTYRFDRAGNQTSVIDPQGRETATAYDGVNRVDTVTSPMSNLTSYDYDDAGNLTRITDPLGRATVLGYDKRHLLTSRKLPGLQPTLYTYDDDGNPTSQTSPSGESKTTWTYNDDGQLDTEVGPRGNVAGATPADFDTLYDFDPAGNLDTVTDPLDHVTDHDYDPAGRLTSVTDPRDNTTSYTYDPAGRLDTVTDPFGKVTDYHYDADGDLDSRTDANNHTTSYGYDDAHRLVSISDPLNRQRTFSYDPEGNLDEVITARGYASGNLAAWTINHDYDARDLLTATTTAQADANASYGYDDDGRLASMTDATGTSSFGYDDAGQLTAVDQPQGDYAYTYQPFGAVESRTLPAAGTIDYGYDNDGQPTSLTADGDTTVFDYNPDGQITRIDYPAGNGMVQTRSYDPTGALDTITNQAAGASQPTSSFAYTRNANGSPTRMVRTRGTTTYREAYVYDRANRLAKYCTSTGSCTGATDYVDYTYDDVGNRTLETRVGGVPNPGSIDYDHDGADQLTTRSTTPTGGGSTVETFNYNADGLRLNGRAWDPLGRLTAYTANNKTTSYDYDGFANRRLVSFDNGSTKKLSWDINQPDLGYPLLRVETRADDSIWAHRYTPDGWALSVKHPGQAFGRSYFHHNGMGSVVDVTTGNGGPAWQYAYDPWGVTTTATQQSASPVDAKLGYTSAYFEATLSAYHLRARDYDPTIGRFVAPDPIAPPIDDPYVASYAYANNQPSVLTDPRGLMPCAACDYGGGAASGGPGEPWDGVSLSGYGHGILDFIGLAPVVGELADGTNALWYAAEGNATNALISCAALWPFGGQSATLGKWGAKLNRSTPTQLIAIGPAPQSAWAILNRVTAKGATFPGYKGGKIFQNLGLGTRLPNYGHGGAIKYRVWDVNPYIKGLGRGSQRLITGSDGSAYYTSNHYGTFIKIR